MSAGLYIHIPFCEKRCGYCDFFVVAQKQPQIPAYLRALEQELTLYSDSPLVKQLRFSTLFFGGGTPSLLAPDQIHALIESATTKLNFVSNPEITIETNPGTMDRDKLKAYREAGVNRLSLGMQSFHSAELFALDRIHTVEDAHRSYDDARTAGFENISFDLIFALPKQPFENWQVTLSEAVALEPEHISAYNLSFESETPLTKRLQRGEISPCSVNIQRKMYRHSVDYLQAHGYEQYEISNFAKPDRECLHNQKYWDGSAYLGLGASSHSFMDERRFWNVRNLREYIQLLDTQTLPIEDEETLDVEQKSFERVLLGLRQRRGVDLKSFEVDLGFSFFEKYLQPLSKFFSCDFRDGVLVSELTTGQRKIKSRLLEIEGGFLKLTKPGLLLNDSVCAAFL